MPEKHRFDETCRYEENFTIPDFSRMLDGKVVVLTGGSYGMGKNLALFHKTTAEGYTFLMRWFCVIRRSGGRRACTSGHLTGG